MRIELETEETLENQCKGYWKDAEERNVKLVEDPTQNLPGFDFPRLLWTTINRLKTANYRCNH